MSKNNYSFNQVTTIFVTGIVLGCLIGYLGGFMTSTIMFISTFEKSVKVLSEIEIENFQVSFNETKFSENLIEEFEKSEKINELRAESPLFKYFSVLLH